MATTCQIDSEDKTQQNEELQVLAEIFPSEFSTVDPDERFNFPIFNI